MVAKISSSNTLYSALAYNQIKVDDEHAKVIFTHKMIEPEDGKFDINTCLRSFEGYLLANRNTEKPVLHISLNPDPKDKLSDDRLAEITQLYLQKMGYGDQPFIVYKHEDIERKHLHIVSLRVDENGRKMNDKFEHRRSMGVCRELEQRYGLVPAGQKQRQEGVPLQPVQVEKGDVKQQIANVIRPIAKEYHFLSLKEYKALLSLYNIGVEEVRGEIKGKEYKGLIYSALNDKGETTNEAGAAPNLFGLCPARRSSFPEGKEKAGNPFKSSLFGKTVGIESIEKRMEKSAEIIKNKGLKERSKKVILAAMRTTNNRSGFEKALERQRISVLFRQNDEGRIYGATFIDHEQKCVFNGSRLGKEFSANVFNDLFNGTGNRPEQPYTFKPNEKQAFEPFQQSNREFDENSNFGGIFDLFTSGNSVGDEIEEQAFVRRLRKKKRQQRGM